MGFKHTGLFPEQAANWDWMIEKIKIKLFNQRFTYYTREIYPLRREIEKNRIKKIVISTISFYW